MYTNKQTLKKMKTFTKTLAAGIAAMLLGFSAQAQTTITYLLVAGGGQGGYYNYYGGGGGGGGGVKSGTYAAASGTYPITVGDGGTGYILTGGYAGANGGNSTAFGDVAIGGGGGGGQGALASSGGSGGGGSNYYTGLGASGTSGQGNSGGNNGTVDGGGGGGGSTQGQDQTVTGVGGNGGTGTLSSITGSSVYYGGGGGGGGGLYPSGTGTGGSGGTGGGGNGCASVGTAGTAGAANTGGGGGGCATYSPSSAGAGGSGVVILSVPQGVFFSTTGNPMISGSNPTIVTYTASGTFILNPITPNPWIFGGNSSTYNGTDWYSIGSQDASSELPFITNNTEQMRIKSDGKVGIGTKIPAYQLDVNGGSSTSMAINATGYLYSNGSFVGSDKRFKKNITKLESVTDKIKKLNGYTYNYNTEEFKEKNFSKEQQIGFIAQEIKEVFPQLVTEDAKGYYAVNYPGMVPVLLEAIKNQQQKIDKQDSINNALQNQLSQLANAINACCTNNNIGSKTGVVSTVNTINLASGGAIIFQNAPNPFGDGTMIKYFVPEGSTNTQVVFYDELGNQLKNFSITEIGAGQLNITSANLAPGTYSYSLIINGKVIDTKKMIKTN